MSLNELTSASCINIMLTKWVQVSIPLLNLSVLCFFTTLENLERLINPNICAKILILDLDMVFVLVSNPKLGKTLPCPFFILDACENRISILKKHLEKENNCTSLLLSDQYTIVTATVLVRSIIIKKALKEYFTQFITYLLLDNIL